jgi:prevent-host-death family protein
MKTVTVRELRNQGGEVLTRVVQGESLIITRDGTEVAELRPLRRRSISVAELIARRASLPFVDVFEFRKDLDDILDQTL